MNDTMKPLTILSTAAGAMFMHGFFRCLKENGERPIKIIGADMQKDPIVDPLIDKYIVVPPINSPEYVDTLLSICKNENVDVFFPHISMELDLILRRIEDFDKLGVKVAITRTEGLHLANNKYTMYEKMRQHGIDTPAYYKISNISDLHNAVKALGFPEKNVCIKVADSSGSRGVRIIKPNLSKSGLFLHEKPSSMITNLQEMVSILSEMESFPDIIAMEYLPGCEFTVDMLADKGLIKYIGGRRNTVSQTSIAMESIIEYNEAAFDISRKVVEIFGLDGNIGIDFMMDENDNPVITDINPRVTATIVMFKDAGINFPYMRVKQLLGEELPQLTLQNGVRMKRRYEEFYKFPVI